MSNITKGSEWAQRVGIVMIIVAIVAFALSVT